MRLAFGAGSTDGWTHGLPAGCTVQSVRVPGNSFLSRFQVLSENDLLELTAR